MKIAIFYTTEFNPNAGGTERISVSLAKQFLITNVDVTFIAWKKNLNISGEYELPAMQYILPNQDILHCDENFKFFQNLLIERGISIILNQDYHIGPTKFCHDVCNVTSIKLITEIHFQPDEPLHSYSNATNWNILSLKQNIVYYAIGKMYKFPFKYFSKYSRDLRKNLREIYKISDNIVVLCDQYKKSYKRIAELKNVSKLCAINNMLSFPYEQKKYAKKKQIIYCSRLDFFQKRPDRLLEIWKEVQDQLSDWNLIILGDGCFRNDLEVYSKRLRLKRIEFKGYANPEKYYEESSILCLTSNTEGWPLILTEAMQYRCVPIAFNSFESIYEIIKDGETGFVIPTFKKDKYVKCLIDLANLPSLYQIGEAAQLSMKKYIPNLIIKQWIDLFNKINKT
jgi:glycosyltransferase involved in cell wall biosynthesis